MSTINQKPNAQITRTAEERIIELRGAIQEAEQIMSLSGHPGWQKLNENIEEQLAQTDRELDNFEKMTERQIVVSLKERKDFRWVVGLVEKLKDRLPELHQALADCEKIVAERKDKLAATR